MSETTTIAYLGPEGTYCNQAARNFAKRLGVEAELMPFSTFSDVFEAVEHGRCEYGVVAIENSLEGPVTATLDAFASTNSVEILGEEIVDIHHCLLMHPEATADDIKVVASHGQGLAQCRHFLKRHCPDMPTITTTSAAEAARKVCEDKTTAAIANSLAAEIYGAKIYAAEIEDHAGDQTAFALIAAQGHEQVLTGANHRTSLALYLKADRPGTLMMILAEFAFAGINLTKIQSRPTKKGLGDYMFFVDLAGNVNDPYVQTALNCLRMKLRDVKVLGSYPVD